jgi:hypothetical protein
MLHSLQYLPAYLSEYTTVYGREVCNSPFETRNPFSDESLTYVLCDWDLLQLLTASGYLPDHDNKQLSVAEWLKNLLVGALRPFRQVSVKHTSLCSCPAIRKSAPASSEVIYPCRILF